MLTESIFLSTVVPGDGGSRLEARIHKPSVPHYWCEKTSSSWFDLWLSVESLLPEVIDCWADNIRCNFVVLILIFLNFVSHKEKLNKKYCKNLWGYCKELHLTSIIKIMTSNLQRLCNNLSLTCHCKCPYRMFSWLYFIEYWYLKKYLQGKIFLFSAQSQIQ